MRRWDASYPSVAAMSTRLHVSRPQPQPHVAAALPVPDNAQRMNRHQGGYIFYAGASLAGASYCRQCRWRPAILPLQLWQGGQVSVKIFIQRLPKVAHFNACYCYWATSVVRARVVGVANVGDSLRRPCSLQHRIYNLLEALRSRQVLATSLTMANSH